MSDCGIVSAGDDPPLSTRHDHSRPQRPRPALTLRQHVWCRRRRLVHTHPHFSDRLAQAEEASADDGRAAGYPLLRYMQRVMKNA